MRRALAIDEASLGPQHPNVAIRLNNLALLLQDTNRPAEAEPLMRRTVAILLAFSQSTGRNHPRLTDATKSYYLLLETMGKSEAEIAEAFKSLATPPP